MREEKDREATGWRTRRRLVEMVVSRGASRDLSAPALVPLIVDQCLCSGKRKTPIRPVVSANRD